MKERMKEKKKIKKEKKQTKKDAAVTKSSLVRRYPKIISILSGLVMWGLVFFILGIPTDIIKNPLYKRMVDVSGLDLFFLMSISLMAGVYGSLFVYKIIQSKNKISSTRADGGAFSGVVGGFFALVCPTCLSILVWLFGASFLMRYVNPLRPFIGILSLGLLGWGIQRNILIIKNKCGVCKND